MGFTKITRTPRAGYSDFYIFYSKNGKKLYHKTNVKALDRHVTKKGELSANHPSFAFDNKAITDEQNKLERIIQEYFSTYHEKPDIDYITDKLKEPIAAIRLIRDSSVLDFMDKFVDHKIATCAVLSSTGVYKTLRGSLEQYVEVRNKKLDFVHITQPFIIDFAKFLLYESKDKTKIKLGKVGNSNNTVVGKLKQLVEFLKWCKLENDINLDTEKIRYWTTLIKKTEGIKAYRPEKLIMKAEEIGLLYTYEFKDDELVKIKDLYKIRDIFIFSCKNGMRISDNKSTTSNMVRTDGHKDRFKKEAKKTGNEFTFELDSISKEILNRYNSNLSIPEKLYNSTLRSLLKEFFEGYAPIFKKKYNKEYQLEYVKIERKGKQIIETKCHKADMFASHNARATSITLDAEGGIPLHKIMKKHGHSKIMTTMHYINTNDIDYNLGSLQ